MKTENIDDVTAVGSNNAVVWYKNNEMPHLTPEECLPVIGSSQLSSILSTLDTPGKPINSMECPQNAMDLIVFPSNDFKLPIVEANNIILATNSEFLLTKPAKKQKKLYSKSLKYIVCDLCPYLCLKESKIKEHIDLIHKTKKPSDLFELKCPACLNIFYHKLSLQSHLTNDHCVNNTADVAKIIQVALYTKKSVTYANKLAENIDISKTPIIIEGLVQKEVQRKTENNVKSKKIVTKLEQLVHSDDDDFANDKNDSSSDAEEMSIAKDVALINKPISNDNSDKIPFSTKRQISISKFFDKKFSVCSVTNCKVRMESKDKLNYHMKCHHAADTMFKCPECPEVVFLWKSLTGHLWRSHKIDMELYACDKCEYRTHSLSKLNNTHKLIHGDLRGFPCDVCEKRFKNDKQLRNHKDTHKKVNEHSICDVCLRTFSDRRQLKIHLDGVHKKLKPFLCNFCGYKGATRGALKMHIRQHTGEKPFSCDSCDYATADHNSLRRHKLRHSGEKPYKCAHCDYQCIQSSTYKVHVKTKHPGLDKDLLFSCPVCPFRSINKEVYTTHISSVHPSFGT